ncbi:MAG: DnaB-like helicase N-terminal domain-containing protein [Terriglobales bacterium]
MEDKKPEPPDDLDVRPPAPQEGWTIIAEEDVVQPHPHLAAEMVLLASVIADNSLCDLLTNFVPDCFCSLSHQSMFKAMLSLRARGITISLSTIDSHCSEGGEAGAGIRDYLSALLLLLPVFAVDQATFYRYMGTVKYQWLTRRLQWCLQTTMESSSGGCSPVHLIDTLQQTLSSLKGEYDLVNRPAPIERQLRCFSGSFDT